MCAGTKEEIDEKFANLSYLSVFTNDNYIDVEDIEDPIKSFTTNNNQFVGTNGSIIVSNYSVKLSQLISHDSIRSLPTA